MTSKPRMRCYLLIIRCVRTKCCLVIFVLGIILLLGKIYQQRKSILNTNRQGDEYDSLQSEEKKHFVPGTFMEKFQPQNISYCQFGFGLPEVLELEDADIKYTPEFGADSNYRIIYNVLEPTYNGSVREITDTVTYCTHATPEFIYYLTEVLIRWEGPVSVATFVPGSDASLMVCLLERLCSCLPSMNRVSLHFIYPVNYPPQLSACPAALVVPKNCTIPPIILSKKLHTFRSRMALTYPVNVARNAARFASQTSFILVSDVELLPSRNLVTNFIKMIHAMEKKSGMTFQHFGDKLVYVIPVFEVVVSEVIPDVKSKLLEMYSQNQAFYFHRWVCSHCQRFPGLQRWLLRKSSTLDNAIQPFFVVRREFPFHRWEPVFIGTNTEPFYSEILTWEGQQDKMTQMHEMCLLKYNFVILDGAFLVHAPGVKRKSDVLRESWRNSLQRENSLRALRNLLIIKTILAGAVIDIWKCLLF